MSSGVRSSLCVAVLLVTGGCASIRRHSVATTLSGSPPVVVSSEVDDTLSSANFAFVNVTFENAGADWVEVTRVELEPDPDLAPGGVHLVTGVELAAWGEAMRRVLEVKRVNESSAYGWSLVTLAAVARVRGARASDVSLAMQTLDLARSAFADDYEDGKRAEGLTTVPLGHLLAGAVLVPPGLHADRWLLLRTQGETARPKTLRAKLVLASGAEASVLLYVGQKGPT